MAFSARPTCDDARIWWGRASRRRSPRAARRKTARWRRQLLSYARPLAGASLQRLGLDVSQQRRGFYQRYRGEVYGPGLFVPAAWGVLDDAGVLSVLRLDLA